MSRPLLITELCEQGGTAVSGLHRSHPHAIIKDSQPATSSSLAPSLPNSQQEVLPAIAELQAKGHLPIELGVSKPAFAATIIERESILDTRGLPASVHSPRGVGKSVDESQDSLRAHRDWRNNSDINDAPKANMSDRDSWLPYVQHTPDHQDGSVARDKYQAYLFVGDRKQKVRDSWISLEPTGTLADGRQVKEPAFEEPQVQVQYPSPLVNPWPTLPPLVQTMPGRPPLNKYDQHVIDLFNIGLFDSLRAHDFLVTAYWGAQIQEESACARQEQAEQPAAHLDAIQQQSSTVDIAEAQEPSQDDAGNASLTNAMGTSLPEVHATEPERRNSSIEEYDSNASTTSKDSNNSSIMSKDSDKFHSDFQSLDACEEKNCRTQPLRPGEVYDLIRGTKRKRQLHDDCERSRDEMYSRTWTRLNEMGRYERGHICGYEHGDGDYEFAEWLVKKKKRVCQPGEIRDAISGLPRRRMLMDDKQGKDWENWTSGRWDRLRGQLSDDLEAKSKIWGYELGDLDLSWSQLKKARKSRDGWWL